MSASVAQTRAAIDSVLRNAGGAYAEYSCKTVSWDDVARGEVGGGLSCWGANITDTYLKGKDGTSLFTVRPQNWNEKLGVVRASDIALLIGNCDSDEPLACARCGPDSAGQALRNVTLEQFLQSPADFGAKYAGLKPGTSLADADADGKISIRFQTVFLPVDADNDKGQAYQFATEAYNYNTRSDSDPRNLILLATTQGLSVQADGRGTIRLLQHAKEGDRVGEYWLEAEKSTHRVGGAQVETAAERKDALSRGKATSEIIGIKAMGTRFNVLMTLQVPLKQDLRDLPPRYAAYGAAKFGKVGSFGSSLGAQVAMGSMSGPLGYFPAPTGCAPPPVAQGCAPPSPAQGCAHPFPPSPPPPPLLYPPMASLPGSQEHSVGRAAMRGLKSSKASGTANAARVSRGDKYGHYAGLRKTELERNGKEHVTVTCVFYNTVAGGVPSEADVRAAIRDMEALYDACVESARLSDAAFDFMKSELTVAQTQEVASSIACQPPSVVTNPAQPSFLKRLTWPGMPAQVNSARPGFEVMDILESKFEYLLRNTSTQAALEVKLIALGAVDGAFVDSKKLIAAKFECLLEEIASADASSKLAERILELKLLVRGAVF